jgi:hypothetical protein
MAATLQIQPLSLPLTLSKDGVARVDQHDIRERLWARQGWKGLGR